LKKFNLKIFCDFDGTVTKNDVWVNSLGKFIKNKPAFSKICDDFSASLITSRECISRELELVEEFTTAKFLDYIQYEELDIYFHSFVNYCRENGYEIFLLSEGLDFYIEYILKREKLDLEYFSNKMVYTKCENGYYKLSCKFPYSDENCTFCGMSKRNILLSKTNDYDGDISVFIGDGVSDFCVSSYADIVFAKNSLASYCWKNNITYFDYNNFNDIINKIIKLKEKNKLKHRQSAQLLRREVFLGG
jgi:HAD superfamily phosphoserine phosphatase-like hydrolase